MKISVALTTFVLVKIHDPMLRKYAAAILSALLLSAGWLGMTGLTLLVAFVPLLWLSDRRPGSPLPSLAPLRSSPPPSLP